MLDIPLMTQSQPSENNNTSAVATGPTSNIGRRRAYEELSKLQWIKYGCCHMTLFSLLSTYSITKQSSSETTTGTLQILLELTNHGKTSYYN